MSILIHLPMLSGGANQAGSSPRSVIDKSAKNVSAAAFAGFDPNTATVADS